MNRNRIDFKLANESGVWWLAPQDLGGYPLPKFLGSIFEGVNDAIYQDLPLSTLLQQGYCIPIPLYSDGPDMYIRLVLGELNAQEEAEWVAQISWKLNLTGKYLLIAEGCDPDILEEQDIRDIMNSASWLHLEETIAADDSSSFWCWTEVPPNHYFVNIYSYLPYDWSSWESIYRTGMATSHPEAEPLVNYFKRTRPNEGQPLWIEEEHSQLHELDLDLYYISFVIQLLPFQTDQKLPQLNQGGFVSWERRKPEQCPLGIKVAKT